MKAHLLLLAALTLFCLGQLGRIPLFNGTVNIYGYEIFLAVYAGVRLWQHKLKPFHHHPYPFLKNSVLIFLGYMGLSLLISFAFFNGKENVIALLYFLRLAFYFLLLVYETGIQETKHQTGLLRRFLVACTSILIATSIIQYLFYPDLRNLFYAGWDPHYYRLFGVFFEPVIAAGVFGLLLIFYWFKGPFNYVFSGIFGMFIVATFSRGAYVALACAVVLYMMKRKLYKMLIVLFCCAVGIFLLLPKPGGEGINVLRTSTILSRTLDYAEGIHIWQQAPILGIGYNHIGAVKQVPQVYDIPLNHAKASFHSSFLIILVTGGVIGLILFMRVLWSVGKIHEMSLYMIVFLSVLSLFDNILLHPFILFLFLVLMKAELHGS